MQLNLHYYVTDKQGFYLCIMVLFLATAISRYLNDDNLTGSRRPFHMESRCAALTARLSEWPKVCVEVPAVLCPYDVTCTTCARSMSFPISIGPYTGHICDHFKLCFAQQAIKINLFQKTEQHMPLSM